MPYNNNDIGNSCPYCSDGIIIKYRSGKLGCDKKCWLNKQSKATPIPQKGLPLATSGNKEVLDAIRIVNDNIKLLVAEVREAIKMFGGKEIG